MSINLKQAREDLVSAALMCPEEAEGTKARIESAMAAIDRALMEQPDELSPLDRVIANPGECWPRTIREHIKAVSRDNVMVRARDVWRILDALIPLVGSPKREVVEEKMTQREEFLYNLREKPLRESDMDIVGGLFAIRFRDGGSTGLAEIYVEDDEWYHLKCTIDRLWLKDLRNVVKDALSQIEDGKPV